jgi:hypothetical protein
MGVGGKRNQYVDVTARSKVPAQNGAKQSQFVSTGAGLPL